MLYLKNRILYHKEIHDKATCIGDDNSKCLYAYDVWGSVLSTRCDSAVKYLTCRGLRQLKIKFMQNKTIT